MNRVFILLFFLSAGIHAQECWQQAVAYDMDIDMDVKKYQYQGNMTVDYTNNSPDVLPKIYFHLYWNAFQPGSLMDERLHTVPDPDKRMVNITGNENDRQYHSRIENLTDDEIGFQKINSITQNGKKLDYKIMGTVMEVTLDKALKQGSSTQLKIDWKAQVPVQIRRSGRNNAGGVDFSMTQWYPKLAMYDEEGWHLDEYIAREFYAPFALFDVKITLPSQYVIGGSGTLQNEKEMPGYSSRQYKRKANTTWHFKAENIHDFAWAADPDFTVDTQNVPNGPKLYFVYKKNLEKVDSWKKIQPKTVEVFEFLSENFGQYPWPNYSVVQGGDGGMEYGMTTLITGNRSYESLLGTTIHEVAHSWYQQLFGIDETRDEWFDEGFTSYAEARTHAALNPSEEDKIHPYINAYKGYYSLVKSGKEEPMSILADYYDTNYAYSLAAYYKGQVLLAQLGYIIGETNLNKTLLKFYDEWKFNHPKYFDFERVAQEVSGINLKWYFNLFVNTTRYIDYGITKVEDQKITLKNESNFPMPLDVLVQYKDGSKEIFYIPLHAMRGEKPFEKEIYGIIPHQTMAAWGWPAQEYILEVNKPIHSVRIDPSERLADVNPNNNFFPPKSNP